MRVANVVFAGGPSLYEARRSRHCERAPLSEQRRPRAFCARRRCRAIAHPDVKALARPRLGFFGVLDERLDIASAARDCAAAPRMGNLHRGPGAEDRPGRRCRRRRTCITSASAGTRTCPRSSRAGTWRCCRLRKTMPRDSSVRRRRSNTWRPAAPIVSTSIARRAAPLRRRRSFCRHARRLHRAVRSRAGRAAGAARGAGRRNAAHRVGDVVGRDGA